jgi:hypothetical protein
MDKKDQHTCTFCGACLKSSNGLTRHLKTAKKCLRLRETQSLEQRVSALEGRPNTIVPHVSGDMNVTNNNVIVNVYNQKIINIGEVKSAIENSHYANVKDAAALKQLLSSVGLNNESVKCTDAHRGVLRYYLDSDISTHVRDIKGESILDEIFIRMTSDGIYFPDKIRRQLEAEFAEGPNRSMTEFLKDQIEFKRWEKDWDKGTRGKGEIRDKLFEELRDGNIPIENL